MEHITKPLIIAVSVIISALVISIAVFLSDKGATIGNAFGTRIAAINRSITDNDLLQFDSGSVSGSDVLNCIRKYRDTVTIRVTKITDTDSDFTTTYNKEDGPRDNLPGNVSSYINPNAYFSGEISRNANGVISEINFVQLQYVADAGNGGGVTPPASGPDDSGNSGEGSGLSQATITALIQTINTMQSQVSEQVTTQTEIINDLLEKFAALQQVVIDGGGSGSGSGSGSGESNEEILTVVNGLTGTVSTLADTLDELVSRFDVLSNTVTELVTKVDSIVDNGSDESDDGSDESSDGSDESIGSGDFVDLNLASESIDTLKSNVSALNSEISELKSAAASESNLTKLQSITSRLQAEVKHAKSIAGGLEAQLVGVDTGSAEELRHSINGMCSVLSDMEVELERITLALRVQEGRYE